MEITEETIFKLITYSGAAKSDIFEAFRLCQDGKYEDAENLMESAKHNLLEAHNTQTSLIQQEAGGEQIIVRLLMVHAQDHLMTCILAKELMSNMMNMQKEINEIKSKIK
ncbi:MAG: lactose/cellobiose transporter subunit [Firmicutes bacterium]|nr:lactose/cellobiose transporter subunit [Bacillota bacterium]